jgi:hypothetical protein
MRRVEKTFKNLPKPMDWLSFLNNDLPILNGHLRRGPEDIHSKWPEPITDKGACEAQNNVRV